MNVSSEWLNFTIDATELINVDTVACSRRTVPGAVQHTVYDIIIWNTDADDLLTEDLIGCV